MRNGSPDAQFRFHIIAPGRTITSLKIQNPEGGKSLWDTIPGNEVWMVAVLKKNKLLNKPDGQLEVTLAQGEEVFDLYVQDNNSIVVGKTNYKVTLSFKDGSQIEIPIALKKPTKVELVQVGAQKGAEPAKTLEPPVPTSQPSEEKTVKPESAPKSPPPTGISAGGAAGTASGPFADKINAVLAAFHQNNEFEFEQNSITGTSRLKMVVSLEIQDDGQLVYKENSWFLPKTKTSVEFPIEHKFSLKNMAMHTASFSLNKYTGNQQLSLYCNAGEKGPMMQCVTTEERSFDKLKTRTTTYATLKIREKDNAEKFQTLLVDLIEAFQTSTDMPEIAAMPEEGTPVAEVSVEKEGKYRGEKAFIDTAGKFIIQPGTKVNNEGFKNGFAKIKVDKKWQYVHRSGKILETDFEAHGHFSEGLAVAKKGSKFGYIDSTGKEMIKPIFIKAGPFSDGLAAVRRDSHDDKYEYIDMRGKRVLKPAYYKAGTFSDCCAWVQLKSDGKRGVIDKKGNLLVEPKFSFVDKFKNGLAKVQYYDKEKKETFSNIVDTSGNLLLKTPFDWAEPDIEKGVVRFGLDKKVGLMDLTGKVIVEPQYRHIDPFYEGVSKFRKEKDGKWGLIDKTGKVLVEPKYSTMSQFSEGLAAVKEEKSGKWGYMDKTGAFVIKPKYIQAGAFSEGLADVAENTGKNSYGGGDYGYIDKTGKMVIQAQFENWGNRYNPGDSFKHGMARIRKQVTFTGKEGKEKRKIVYGYIDKTGKVIVEPKLQGADPFR